MKIDYRVLFVVSLFILFDFITGLIKAWKAGTVNSTKMREGLINKVAEIATMVFGYFCEYALPIIGVETDIKFGGVIACYITLMELFSIIENLGEVYPAIGKILSAVFEKFKHHIDAEGVETNDEN